MFCRFYSSFAIGPASSLSTLLSSGVTRQVETAQLEPAVLRDRLTVSPKAGTSQLCFNNCENTPANRFSFISDSGGRFNRPCAQCQRSGSAPTGHIYLGCDNYGRVPDRIYLQ